MLQNRLSEGSPNEGGGEAGGAAKPETDTSASRDHLVLAGPPVATAIGGAVPSSSSAVESVERRHPLRLPSEKTRFCLRCTSPISIYGRLIPCEHVLCLSCAANVRACYLCGKHIEDIQHVKMEEEIFVCAVSRCLVSFLKWTEFDAHIHDKHTPLLQSGKEMDTSNITKSSSADTNMAPTDQSTITQTRSSLLPISNSQSLNVKKARRKRSRGKPPPTPSMQPPLEPKPAPLYKHQHTELQPDSNPAKFPGRTLQQQPIFEDPGGFQCPLDSYHSTEKTSGIQPEHPFTGYPTLHSNQPRGFPANANQGPSPPLQSNYPHFPANKDKGPSHPLQFDYSHFLADENKGPSQFNNPCLSVNENEGPNPPDQFNHPRIPAIRNKGPSSLPQFSHPHILVNENRGPSPPLHFNYPHFPAIENKGPTPPPQFNNPRFQAKRKKGPNCPLPQSNNPHVPAKRKRGPKSRLQFNDLQSPANESKRPTPSLQFKYPNFPTEESHPFYNPYTETPQPEVASFAGLGQGSLLVMPPFPVGAAKFPSGYHGLQIREPASKPSESLPTGQWTLEGYANLLEPQARTPFSQGSCSQFPGSTPSIPFEPLPMGQQTQEFYANLPEPQARAQFSQGSYDQFPRSTPSIPFEQLPMGQRTPEFHANLLEPQARAPFFQGSCGQFPGTMPVYPPPMRNDESHLQLDAVSHRDGRGVTPPGLLQLFPPADRSLNQSDASQERHSFGQQNRKRGSGLH